MRAAGDPAALFHPAGLTAGGSRSNMDDNGKLRAFRLSWGWSQDRLAKRLSCTRSLVSAMELGRTPVLPAVWERLGLDGPPDTIPVVPESLRAYGRRSPGNKIQVVVSDKAAAIWRRWVADGQGSASERVSALIESAGVNEKAP